MNADFSRTLALLRQEAGISQRKAARELGISQALLSHYENGVREPGLAFVRKVCDYYHVSADYLLGRTLSRDGGMIEAEALYDSGEEKGSLRGSIQATLQKKLIANTTNLLFGLLGKLGSREALSAAGDYLGAALYQLYRPLHRHSGAKDTYFSLSGDAFTDGAAEAVMQKERVAYLSALRAAGEAEFPVMENAALAESYPGCAQSATQVLHTVEEKAAQLFAASEK